VSSQAGAFHLNRPQRHGGTEVIIRPKKIYLRASVPPWPVNVRTALVSDPDGFQHAVERAPVDAGLILWRDADDIEQAAVRQENRRH